MTELRKITPSQVDTVRGYPVLKNARVRGVPGEFYLQELKGGHEFSLSDSEAEVLLDCTGSNSAQSLFHQHNLSEPKYCSMVSTLSDAELLQELDHCADAPSRWPVSSSPYLRDIQIEATGRCNLKCKHCYGADYFPSTSKEELSTQELLNVVRQAGALNASRCFFSGGEALIRKDLPTLVSACADSGIFVAGIFTNGTLWREDVMDAVACSGMKTVFLVSVDGPTAQLHDEIRGHGRFEKTIQFIRECIQRGFHVTVNTIVMKSNVSHLMEMRSVLSDMGVSRWRVAVPREQGASTTNYQEVVPDWSDVFTAYETLMHAEIADPGRMRVQLSSIFKTEFVESKRFYLFRSSTSCCQYKRQALVVSADGTVIACPAAFMFPLGNVRDSTLKEIWENKNAQEFKNIPVEDTACGNCDLLPYCGGGCRVMAWEKNGSLTSVDPCACPMYRFFHDRVLPLYRKHGIEGVFLPNG